MKKAICLLLLVSVAILSISQKSDLGSAGILHELYKLQNPTRVIYIAAHPDDENTSMISWLANGLGCETAYLSLTRGDGGQNLIGKELGAKLGVLRTQELIQARKIDGGNQFFSRAVDFSYSKSSEETLEKWGENEVLQDVVWIIRTFRPDVVITRFSPDRVGRHGHHTASAMLAIKAFKQSSNKNFFPEQLKHVETWKPRRIYWNTSVWWGDPLDSLVRTDDRYLKIDVGDYNPLLGLSYNELASLSRSQHKSQGFGVLMDRGSKAEYLYYLEGEKAFTDLFDGIDQSWRRYGFSKGDKMLQKIIDNFDPVNPSASVESLFQLRNKADQINDKVQRGYLKQKLDNIILSCIGWHVELLSSREYVSQGTEDILRLEVLERSPLVVKLKKIKLGDTSKWINATLIENEIHEEMLPYNFDKDFSQPYWLQYPYENLFTVTNSQLIGKPENDPHVEAVVTISIGEHELQTKVPASYKYLDRIKGEIINPVFVTPEVVVNQEVNNMIFVKNKSQLLFLEVKFFKKEPTKLQFKSDDSWKIEPDEILVSPSDQTTVDLEISIIPLDEKNSLSTLQISFASGMAKTQSLIEIEYDHIDKRLVFKPVVVKLIRLDLVKDGIAIGYIPGAGDEVARAIRQIGYNVEILNEEKIRNTDLSQYKSIVAGIRAYNTETWLPGVKNILMEYVKNGGNYVVQYNTRSRDLLNLNIGPYPFEISRERVTEEDSEVDFLIPKHPLLNKPNKLTTADFENWVHERGLYFAGSWDKAYKAPIGWHDKGEPSRNGGLIIADCGKGAFIYTGISFFRELPAGIPGAFRLMANILSYKNPNCYDQ